jgi:7-cyano-7-deazaguanine synthase
MNKKKNCVVSLSGGLDSSTLLLRCLKEYENVVCISFDYGQKHRVELERAKELVDYINDNLPKMYSPGDTPEGMENTVNKINYQLIKLDGLSNLLVSGLVDNDSMEMKKGHYAHENALTTVVPNRNAIFASLAYAVALSVVKKTDKPCDIALGTHMGDFDNEKKEGIYPDCSEAFRTALEHALKIGNWDSDKVNYYAPYNITDKTGILRNGVELCNELEINFNEVYKRTNTSYAPILLSDGKWASDYKSGSSVERIESFMDLGLIDPVQYAEEDGKLVSWDFVASHVEQILKDFNS